MAENGRSESPSSFTSSALAPPGRVPTVSAASALAPGTGREGRQQHGAAADRWVLGAGQVPGDPAAEGEESRGGLGHGQPGMAPWWRVAQITGFLGLKLKDWYEQI